jgi:RNA polymerase sigma-70 factor (ECF subfamily)
MRFGRDRGGKQAQDEQAARRDAFAAVYEALFDAVYRYCRIRVADVRDAEDLAAVVFARAYAAFPPEQNASMRSWVFAIAHNTVANHYRDHRNTVTQPLDDRIDLPDPDPLPEQIVLATAERDSLRFALHRLTAEQRQVVELRLAGLTGPEIAAVLGRSHAAVKMLQLRAIERLRQTMLPTESPAITEESDHARR